jgi:NADP-dependent 3-hydroxy acid dehydrogenase YdfG
MSDFDATQMPGMTGKTVIVTGGNSGIGRACAKLAQRLWTVSEQLTGVDAAI